MNKEIKQINFIFENCQSIKVSYDKFKFFNIDDTNFHFRIEGYNIGRFKEYQDISDINIIYQDNTKERNVIKWAEGSHSNNDYQFINYSNWDKRIIEITISKEKYLHKEIRETKKEVDRLNEKLEDLYRELTLI